MILFVTKTSGFYQGKNEVGYGRNYMRYHDNHRLTLGPYPITTLSLSMLNPPLPQKREFIGSYLKQLIVCPISGTFPDLAGFVGIIKYHLLLQIAFTVKSWERNYQGN